MPQLEPQWHTISDKFHTSDVQVKPRSGESNNLNRNLTQPIQPTIGCMKQLINISKSGTSKEENFKLREERYIMEMNSK
jgi:hypothetical protein